MLERPLKLAIVNGWKESITNDTVLDKKIQRDGRLTALRTKGILPITHRGGAQISSFPADGVKKRLS
jgi:hypothetical protein